MTFSLFGGLFVFALVTLPVVVPALALVDLLLGGRWQSARFVLFLFFFLCAEVVGVTVAGLAWLAAAGRHTPAFLERNFRLQCRWASFLLGAATALFRLRFEVSGTQALEGARPVVVLVRHVSVGDTLLPAVFISSRTGTLLRYVLKEDLLWDPCLDVVGQRLPNSFVRRGTSGAASEVEKVVELARDLGPREGVLIFPEGTRFTKGKREKVLARLAETGQERLLAAAAELRHVLPPRLGGSLALLDAAPDADVVFCAHTGFEGISTLGDLWRGSLMDRTVSVRFWRCPAEEVPRDEAARVEWLLAQWRDVDRFVDEALPAAAAPVALPA